MKYQKFILVLFIVTFSFIAGKLSSQEFAKPKNVILFIGDGMGYNHVDATSIFRYGETGQLIFESPEWISVGQASYPAIFRTKPDTVYAEGYDPQRAWNDTDYLKMGYTDSGAAGTAMSTGSKTFPGAIGIGVQGDTLQHLSQFAKDIGKSAGIITSVQVSHATPAAFAAHNKKRSNYEEIAQQMILETRLDVFIGCGHPRYNDNGRFTFRRDHRYVGGRQLWKQLRKSENRTDFTLNGYVYTVADIDGDGSPDPWTLVTKKNDFHAIAQGKRLTKRLLGIPKVRSTLQLSRKGSDVMQPYVQPFNSKVPDLVTITLAAINVLNQNPEGFFLMVEGGAIDWAGHDNHSGRMIEEMDDFVNSVAAVVEWVETYSNWEETLVIVTSDHETGMLFGPADDASIMQPVKSKGKGNLPEMIWHSTGHTNMLVPVYVRGAGSEIYSYLAGNHDPVVGPFLQNVDIPNAIFRLWGRE